jgi:TPR repeat protein
MEMYKTVVYLSIIAILDGSCTSMETAKPKSIVINESMAFHSSAERRQTEKKAITGDAEAAKRLGDCAIFVDNDLVAAERWFKLAASYGDKDAKVSLKTVREIRKEQNR